MDPHFRGDDTYIEVVKVPHKVTKAAVDVITDDDEEDEKKDKKK